MVVVRAVAAAAAPLAGDAASVDPFDLADYNSDFSDDDDDDDVPRLQAASTRDDNQRQHYHHPQSSNTTDARHWDKDGNAIDSALFDPMETSLVDWCATRQAQQQQQ